MPLDVQIFVVILASFLAGVLIVWFLMRSEVLKAFETGRLETTPEIERLTGVLAEKEEALRSMEGRLTELNSGIQDLKEERTEVEKKLIVAEHTNQSIPELKSNLEDYKERELRRQKELTEISALLAQEKERTVYLKAAAAKLLESEKTIEELRKQIAGQDSEIQVLKTRMDEERKQAEEKLILLNEAKAELTSQFRLLAQEILDEKGKVFGEQSQKGLKNLLDPFRDQLNDFKQKVDNVYVNEAKERATLKKEIETLRDLNQQISREAINLAQALKGDKKAQGIWGEMILERVLEQSGLRKGIEYETQGSFRDADGKLFRPDVIVHLPEEKDIVIDSKVSLIAYERYASAEDDKERSVALSEHVKAVRSHIDSLNNKDYSGLKGIRSLDLVFMFMPIEAAFVTAFKEDDNLFTYSFEKRIVVVTPSTMLATLKTIENIWRYERQNRNAQAIVVRAKAMYDKLRLFVEGMEKLGKQIDNVQETYDEVMNRLVRGKGNVISQASRLPGLGVAVKKELPRTVTEIAEIEAMSEQDLESGTSGN
jgi:DNA recombination protein RmuC